LLAACLAGAGGNLLAGLLSLQTHRSLGASGMVMGSLGLMAVQSFSLWRTSTRAVKLVVSGVCGGIMLFVLLALTPGTDIVAHLGGFLGGLVLGVLLSLAPKMAHKLYANLACGVAFAILVIVPWWLALWGAGR
jgi:membrane associated rhomboid family serine protease